jgi:hypothetical protein
LLYLVKAQERNHDKFNLSDNVVLSSEQLIDCFIKQSTDRITGADILHALNIYTNTLPLLASPAAVLNKIWGRAFESANWVTLAADWEQGNETDFTIKQKIESTVFFQVAFDERARGILTSELLSSLLISYQSQNPGNTALTRLLSTVFSLVQQRINNAAEE